MSEEGPPPPGPEYQPYSPPPYGPPQPHQPPPAVYGYAPGPVLPDHPSATTAFILGLVSLVGGFFCGLPILAGPFAWVVGARTRREIDANPQAYGGRQKAVAGMIMGIVATGLLALVVIVVGVALLVIVLAADS